MAFVIFSFIFVTCIIGIRTLGEVLTARARLKGGVAEPARSGTDSDRIARIEEIVETMAIEIERISEAQRFTTKLLSERRAEELPPARSRDPERVVTPH